MPCRDDGPPLEELRAEELREQQKKLDKVTDLLCGLCAGLERNGQFTAKNGVTAKLRSWWKRHQAKDTARKQREEKRAGRAREIAEARASGLSKLTPAEKLALGIR